MQTLSLSHYLDKMLTHHVDLKQPKTNYPVMLCYWLIDTITQDNAHSSLSPSFLLCSFTRSFTIDSKHQKGISPNLVQNYCFWIILNDRDNFIFSTYNTIFCMQRFLVSPSPIFWIQSKNYFFISLYLTNFGRKAIW